MGYGYHGKILKIDLTYQNIEVEKKKDSFYRKYLGGPGIGAYYALKEIPKLTNPLGPDNVLIIACTVLTGAPGPAVSRFTVSAKSPLTGAFGKSESGGWWGPKFKATGYDALVIRGKAEKPSFIFIDQGKVSIKNAEDLWGKCTKEVQDILVKRLDRGIQVLQIGQGGENQVLYANIVNSLSHFSGRNGMGAVIGSKNLKAVVVRGNKKTSCFDEDSVKEITRWVVRNMKGHPLASALHEVGTSGGVTAVNAEGALPTNNWTKSVFAAADKIGSDALEEILINRKSCYSCPICCKRVVKIKNKEFSVDPDYGGPEYETLVVLGSNCSIDDIKLIAKANELCNKYTIDTISFGMTLSFAMHCYEEGLITTKETDGYQLKFGNKDILLPLIEETVKKEGFGQKLALGSKRLAREIGKESYKFLREVKGQEIPMHDPRVKSGLGLQFALSSNGADHWAAQHDPFFVEEDLLGLKAIKPLGILEPIPANDLSSEKVRFFYYTNLMNLMYDCLGACVFGVVARSILPLNKLIDLVQGVTGWDTSLWEMLKVGERTANLMRMFNVREGFSRKDDKLPGLFFENIKGGPLDGKNAMDREAFRLAIREYYQMVGWDTNGKPLKGKLDELGISKDFKEFFKG